MFKCGFKGVTLFVGSFLLSCISRLICCLYVILPVSFQPVDDEGFFNSLLYNLLSLLPYFLAEGEFQGDNLRGELKSDKKRNVYKDLHKIPRRRIHTQN